MEENKRLENQSPKQEMLTQKESLRIYEEVMLKRREEYFGWIENAKQAAKSDPTSLIEKGEVTDTPLMRRFAKDIKYCQYQYRNLNDDHDFTTFFLRKPDLYASYVDFGKLRTVLKYEYGITADVEAYFMQYRLAELMQLVNEQTSQQYREILAIKEQQEQAIRQDILDVFSHHTNGRGFRMNSNITFTTIDIAKVEDELYKVFHIILSPMEKLGLDSVQDYIDHIICKMRESGLLYNK